MHRQKKNSPQAAQLQPAFLQAVAVDHARVNRLLSRTCSAAPVAPVNSVRGGVCDALLPLFIELQGPRPQSTLRRSSKKNLPLNSLFGAKIVPRPATIINPESRIPGVACTTYHGDKVTGTTRWYLPLLMYVPIGTRVRAPCHVVRA